MSTPVLDYASPQAPPPKRKMTAKGMLVVWSCVASALLAGSGDGARQQPQADRISGAFFAILLAAAVVLTTVVIPRFLNQRALAVLPETEDELLPVPRAFRVLLKSILFVALVLSTCVQQCPHGTFLTFSSTWITLQGGPPCRNRPHATPAVAWVFARLVG